tara:strand:- start:198 stop:317 length:120 start_codon:yes stop_codon:yes gene_type:complete
MRIVMRAAYKYIGDLAMDEPYLYILEVVVEVFFLFLHKI